MFARAPDSSIDAVKDVAEGTLIKKAHLNPTTVVTSFESNIGERMTPSPEKYKTKITRINVNQC